MRWSSSAWLGVILVLYLAIGGLYAAYTPDWQAPDEPAHYNYVSYLANHGALPVLQAGDYPHDYLEQIKSARFPANMSIDPIRYEAWQPPLYYFLAVPFFKLGGGALLPLRLFSLILGAGVVITAYAVGLSFRSGDAGLALTASALVAFVPMHLSVMASVNNDTLAELLIAVIALLVIRWLAREEPGLGCLICTGVLLGLGLLTKATVYYVALPLVGGALLLTQRQLTRLLRQAAIVLGISLGIALPWYVRNVAVYGWPDILGKLNHDRIVVGQLRTAEFLADVGLLDYLRSFFVTTFHSFWGQFGWMAVPMDNRLYLVLGVLSGLAVLGCLLYAWQARGRSIGSGDPPQIALTTSAVRPWYTTLVLLAWIALTVGGYVYYNLSFVQFQGRYLFPALIPIALWMVLGWRTAFSKQWTGLAAGLCALVTFIYAIASVSARHLDKWAVAIGGGTAAALAVRSRLPARPDDWLATVPVVGIMGLSIFCLFAFIVPYL